MCEGPGLVLLGQQAVISNPTVARLRVKGKDASQERTFFAKARKGTGRRGSQHSPSHSAQQEDSWGAFGVKCKGATALRKQGTSPPSSLSSEAEDCTKHQHQHQHQHQQEQPSVNAASRSSGRRTPAAVTHGNGGTEKPSSSKADGGQPPSSDSQRQHKRRHRKGSDAHATAHATTSAASHAEGSSCIGHQSRSFSAGSVRLYGRRGSGSGESGAGNGGRGLARSRSHGARSGSVSGPPWGSGAGASAGGGHSGRRRKVSGQGGRKKSGPPSPSPSLAVQSRLQATFPNHSLVRETRSGQTGTAGVAISRSLSHSQVVNAHAHVNVNVPQTPEKRRIGSSQGHYRPGERLDSRKRHQKRVTTAEKEERRVRMEEMILVQQQKAILRVEERRKHAVAQRQRAELDEIERRQRARERYRQREQEAERRRQHIYALNSIMRQVESRCFDAFKEALEKKEAMKASRSSNRSGGGGGSGTEDTVTSESDECGDPDLLSEGEDHCSEDSGDTTIALACKV